MICTLVLVGNMWINPCNVLAVYENQKRGGICEVVGSVGRVMVTMPCEAVVEKLKSKDE